MKDAIKSILVTGGAGFIGSHLVDSFVTETPVTVLDDLSSGTQDNHSDHATLEVHDIRDQETVTEIVADADLVFHQAALVSVQQSIEQPLDSHTINATGTLNVLEAARHHDTRTIVASSAAIYGHPQYTPIDEAHPTIPTSPYGLDKLTADHHTRLYHELYGLDTVALRYFNVYGPRQRAGDYAGVIATFIDQALNDDPITVHGNGEQTRDFIHVDDVVRANRLAAETDHVGEAYNIATGEATSIRELAETIQDLTDTDSDIVHVEGREGDIDHSVADIGKAGELLGFEPEVGLEEGLEETIEWYQILMR